MLKILHIIPSLGKGGAERLVLNICNELNNKEDISVKIAIFRDDNQYEFLSKNTDINFCPSKVALSITGKTVANISSLMNLISDYKPNIIHSHLFEAEFISRWEIISGIKYFSHCHDNMKQFANFGSGVFFKKERFTNYYEKQLIIRKYIECNNRFIAISRDTETYFKKVLPQELKNNVTFLNNAIDFERFKSINRLLNFYKNQKFNLINVGSLIEIKNHLFLVEVINILNKKGYIDYNLTIIGDGIFRERIENRINKYGLQDRIKLLGLVDNVEEYLKSSDLYVYSCIKEGFGLTLIEAMASGLPVICLDGKGNRDIIEDGKNGFMISDNNPETFVNKIIELTNNNDLYQNISKYAIEFAKRYDIKEYIDRLLEIYST